MTEKQAKSHPTDGAELRAFYENELIDAPQAPAQKSQDRPGL